MKGDKLLDQVSGSQLSGVEKERISDAKVDSGLASFDGFNEVIPK